MSAPMVWTNNNSVIINFVLLIILFYCWFAFIGVALFYDCIDDIELYCLHLDFRMN